MVFHMPKMMNRYLGHVSNPYRYGQIIEMNYPASDNPELKHIDSPEKIVSHYSLEYMIKVIRSIGKASKMVNLEYDTQKPMHLSFDMPSATKVEYYLAPRVQ